MFRNPVDQPEYANLDWRQQNNSQDLLPEPRPESRLGLLRRFGRFTVATAIGRTTLTGRLGPAIPAISTTPRGVHLLARLPFGYRCFYSMDLLLARLGLPSRMLADSFRSLFRRKVPRTNERNAKDIDSPAHGYTGWVAAGRGLVDVTRGVRHIHAPSQVTEHARSSTLFSCQMATAPHPKNRTASPSFPELRNIDTTTVSGSIGHSSAASLPLPLLQLARPRQGLSGTNDRPLAAVPTQRARRVLHQFFPSYQAAKVGPATVAVVPRGSFTLDFACRREGAVKNHCLGGFRDNRTAIGASVRWVHGVTTRCFCIVTRR